MTGARTEIVVNDHYRYVVITDERAIRVVGEYRDGEQWLRDHCGDANLMVERVNMPAIFCAIAAHVSPETRRDGAKAEIAQAVSDARQEQADKAFWNSGGTSWND